MGDSDDDFDSRRNRDKFRRERDDFNGNRANNHNRTGGGEWNDGRDRSNQFRRQYSGGGPPQSRFSRSPARYDMSPPQNKRFRRDWDGPDQPFDAPPVPPIKESNENMTQPQFLSFKNFLLEQDDNIDQEEAVKLYSVYKNDFRKTQINEFFLAHKDEDWFRLKYHPDEYSKRIQEQKQIIDKRRDIFFELYNNNLSVDIEHEKDLIKFLDTAVNKMEGSQDENCHRTTSIFFRQLPMKTTKDELENLCKTYEGFRRICLTDPAPERKFLRRGWATFDSNAQIRNICYEFNSIKLHDLDLGAIVNRELKNRLRSVNGTGLVQYDLRMATKMVRILDEQWNNSDFLLDKSIENEIKALDQLILYLRIVYSVDYYNGSEYTQEDSMPNRCGVLHVRNSNDTTGSIEEIDARLKNFFEMHEKLNDEEGKELGAKNEEEEIEKFMNANCQEVSKDKWSCPLSGKKFKGPEFVRKHILNKHQDKIDEVKKEVAFFNNYLYDPKRPQLPEYSPNKPVIQNGPHPSGLPLPTPMGPQPLINRPPLWPTMPAPQQNYFPNHYHQPRHHRAQFMYNNGPGYRPPNNRALRSYEDLDAPNEI